MDRIKNGKSGVDNWNFDYENHKIMLNGIRLMIKYKHVTDIDEENVRISRRLCNIKGMYDRKNLEKDFLKHQEFSKLNKKFYTPRGFGNRKALSLPGVNRSSGSTKQEKEKDKLTQLHEAVNQFDRADKVLMKTLILYNYKERMKTKTEFELKYDTDLTKGLIKVLDKEFEPLVVALLCDLDAFECDRIYESLYDANDAAVVVTESLLSRNIDAKQELLDKFEEKIDSNLSDEIREKIDGDLKAFLSALLENNNLDSEDIDEKRAEMDASELKKGQSFSSSLFLNVLRSASRRQLKFLFENYQKMNGHEIWNKMDSTKAIVKAVKFMQIYLADPDAFTCDKLIVYLKNKTANKSDFLRLFFSFDDVKLAKLIQLYKQKTNSNLDDDIRANFAQDVSKLIVKRLQNNDDAISDFK